MIVCVCVFFFYTTTDCEVKSFYKKIFYEKEEKKTKPKKKTETRQIELTVKLP
jgi:hypothetical protein